MGLALYFQIGLAALAFFACLFTYARVRASERFCRRSVGEVLDAIGALREQLAIASALRAELQRPASAPALPEARPICAPDLAAPVLRDAAPQPATVRPPPRKVSARLPVDVATITEAERARGLTIAMALPADDRPTLDDGDGESDEEFTRVMKASEQPSAERRGLSQDEAPRRRAGTYSIVNQGGAPAKPGEDSAPVTPTQPSRRRD
jgi:hypothetical protein